MGFAHRAMSIAVLAGLVAGCVSRDGDPLDRRAAPARTIAVEPGAAPASAAGTAETAPAPAAPLREAAAPATEQIVVVGHSLTGLWKVNSPKRLGMEVGLFSGVRIRYSGETGDRDLCELRQTGSALEARCLRLARSVSGAVDGDSITLRSWIGPASLILQAAAESGGALAGTIGGGALGVQLTGGVPVRATRIAAPADAPDRPSAPLVRAVLADIAAGRLTAGRYAPEAAVRLEKDLDDMRSAEAALGPVERVAYLDRLLPRHPYDPREQPLEVYRVDRANGSQLCGISLGPPAAVADFICR